MQLIKDATLRKVLEGTVRLGRGENRTVGRETLPFREGDDDDDDEEGNKKIMKIKNNGRKN